MATLLLTGVIGPAIGANTFWMGVLAMAGGYLDQKLFPPDPIEGAKMADLRLQTSTYGAPIQQVFGTSARIAGNIIWGTNFIEHEEETGGKGGGPSQTEYTYTISFAIALCEGPILGIKRVWADGKLLFDTTDSNDDGIQYTLYPGTEAQTPDTFIEGIEGVGNVPAYKGLAYIVFKDFDVSDYGNRIPTLTFETIPAVSDLKAVVEKICTDSGLAADEFDASDLTGNAIIGYTVAGNKSGRNKIEPLQTVYLFDAAEKFGKLIFTRRIKNLFSPTVYALDADELGADDNKPAGDIYNLTRKQEKELPRQMTVSYISVDKEYQTGAMTAQRVNTYSRNEMSTTVDVVLSDNTAKGLSETILYSTWRARTSCELSIPAKFAAALPGDVIVFPLKNGRRMPIIIQKSSFGKPGLNKIQGVETAPGANEIISRVMDSNKIQSLPAAASVVTGEFIDLPVTPWETDTTPGVYVAVTGEPFRGANIYRSNDGGTSWALAAYNQARAVIGHTLTALAAGPENVFDEKNTVDILVINGTLASRPKADVLNGYNAAIIGGEIIQFKNAVLIAANTYRLSGLLRGRMGTEDQITGHISGERFSLLSSATMTKIAINTGDWFNPILYRVGPSLLPNTDATYQNYTVTSGGRSARPWSPCHIKAVRNGAGDLNINWIRRSRTDYAWKPYVDAALGETIESYEIEIIHGGALKRTITTATLATTYTAAQQVADLGGLAALGSLTVKVYQMSETRGRGIGKEIII